MNRTRPMLLILALTAAILWPLSNVVRAERIGRAYRGPIEKLTSSGAGTDDESEPVLPGGEGEGGGEGGPGEGGPGEGGPAPGPGDNRGGKVAVFDGKRLWNWWWEYNKDRFLARATVPGRINAGSAQYWFGSGAKYPPREIVPVSDQARDTTIFPALKRALKDSDIAVRTDACTALARLGLVAVADKDKVEGQSNNLVVRELIRVIERHPGTKAGRELVESALLGIGICGDADGCNYLKGHLPGNDEERAYAFLAFGLARFHDAARLLSDSLPKNNRNKPGSSQLAAIHALGIMGREAVPHLKEIGALDRLIKLANKRGSQDVTVMQAVAALGRLGQGFKTVRAAFTSKSKDVQYTAVLAMPGFADSERDTGDVKAAAKFLMTKAFKAGEGQIKNFSVFAAGDLAMRLNPNSATRERLLKHLREAVNKNDTYLRACAAVACGVADDRNARDVIIDVLKSNNDTHVLAAMCMGLGLLRDTRQASVNLIRDRVMLQSKWGADNRGGAAMGLALTGDTTRIAELQRFHDNNRDRFTKRHTPLAIGVLGGGREAKELIKMFSAPFDSSDLDPVSNAVFALAWIRDQDTLDALVGLTKHENKRVRGMAVIALGRMGARDRIDPLTRCYENMSHNNRFRWGILYSISRIL